MGLAVQSGIEQHTPFGVLIDIVKKLRADPPAIVANFLPQFLLRACAEIMVQDWPGFWVGVAQPETAAFDWLTSNQTFDQISSAHTFSLS